MEKIKKIGWLGKTREFIKSTLDEFSKCVWPTREKLFHYTFIVILTTFIMASFVAAVDFVTQRIITFLIGV